MHNLIVRSISGAVYVAILVGAILAGGGWLVALLCLFSVVGMWELAAMNSPKIPRFAFGFDAAAGIFLILASYFFCRLNHSFVTCAALCLICVILRMIVELYSLDKNPVDALGRSLMSLVYVALPLALVPVIYYIEGSSHIILAMLIFIWLNDTGAFCTGSLIGRHKLFERISPKKTWEGFFGGMAFCIIAAFVMRGCFPGYFRALGYGEICLMAIMVSVVATFGDLLESMIKRTAGVKDSGKIIPGHGGILDRIDSLLMVIPATVAFLALI